MRLQNNTNAIITPQAVDYTERQVLQGGEAAVLRGFPIPATVRMARQDDGFIEAKPASTKTGILEIAALLNQSMNVVIILLALPPKSPNSGGL